MKPLKGRRDWPKLAVFDIEAEKWVKVTLVCHVDEYGARKAFWDVPSYLNWLFRGFEGDHVWAHWGGHYDHRFIIQEATMRGWSWETVQSGNLIIIVTVMHPKTRKKIHFCESARLMPDSVERIGKTIDLPKLDVDRSHIEKLSLPDAMAYCLRDCDIVLKGLQYMRKALKLIDADFAYTLASVSSRWVRRSSALQWQKFYVPDPSNPRKKIYSPQMLLADEFCMPAYFGGRTEVFKAGKFTGPLYYYDIRSSYPWSMTLPLPAYLKDIGPPPKNTRRALEKCGISEAIVTVPDTYLPILPVRGKGKLLFPVGTFKGRWTNLELVEAIKRGAKVKLTSQCTFYPMTFLKNFVDTFYELRLKAIEEGDPFRSYAYKIALNSLYGKLIESVDRKSIVHGSRAVNRAIAVHGEKAIEPTPCPGVYAVSTTQDGSFRHVAAGAYVTARSRLRLFEGLEKARQAGGNVYYCDTDSIVTDVPLTGEKDELGGFKLEATFSEFEALAPKVYRAITDEGKRIWKVKGVPIRVKREGVPIPDEECERRWRDYVEGRAVEKEGITGFATDLRHSRISPQAQILSRAMRNPDTKRIHTNGDSVPLSLSL